MRSTDIKILETTKHGLTVYVGSVKGKVVCESFSTSGIRVQLNKILKGLK